MARSGVLPAADRGHRVPPHDELAPTEDLLATYRKRKGSWQDYEKRFRRLIKARGIERSVPQALLDMGCLLCSEHEPDQCHRRLVAEYLQEQWGDMEIEHLM